MRELPDQTRLEDLVKYSPTIPDTSVNEYRVELLGYLNSFRSRYYIPPGFTGFAGGNRQIEERNMLDELILLIAQS